MTTDDPRISSLNELRAAYDAELPALCDDVLSYPWTEAWAYQRWLAQTYEYVYHTTRVMALAASRLDGRNAWMHLPVLKHTLEEASHEKLLLNDLAALGSTIEQHPPLPITTAFWQSLYYQVEHVNPLSLFGRVLVLEGVSAVAASSLAEIVTTAHGSRAATFLRVHGESDPGHVEEVFKLLEHANGDDCAAILASLRGGTRLYRSILREIRAN